MRPKIYDCFCYCNEDMLLELRFETLWDYVDYFVISEAVYTQVGNPKPLNFDINNFSKYQEKIRYLVVDHFPDGPMDFWKNENYQRNYLINGLYDAQDQDWILISDLDEIPRPDTISQFNPQKYKRGDFSQRAYVYRFNNLSIKDDGSPKFWPGSKITTFKYLRDFFKTASIVRIYKTTGVLRGIKRWLFNKTQTQLIVEGGWHFTWIFDTQRIIQKLASIAEQQYNRPEYRVPTYIEDQINAGRDIFDSQSSYVPQAVELPEFPSYLVTNKEKYTAWFR